MCDDEKLIRAAICGAYFAARVREYILRFGDTPHREAVREYQGEAERVADMWRHR